MGKRDKRVDAYITKSAPFAQPILKRFREIVHKGCPDVEETMKWSFPHFDYKGMLCSMAAFKQHCAIGFWKASLMSDAKKLATDGETAMGHFGRIESIDDLPADRIILSYVKEAVRLNDAGIKIVKKKPAVKKKFIVPEYLMKAIRKSQKARATFEAFSPSHKRDYVEWIVEAKTEETRERRLATAIEWMEEGKSRTWKYKQKK